MKIYYNSSMPRAGSTLLQNILGQNPDFYVTPTSGLLELIFAARGNYTNSPEFKAQDSEEMKKAFMGFCKGGMEGYFKAITKKPVIVDKSRGWGIHYPLLAEIFPKPKVICIVRDLRDVIASMEKNFRKNQHMTDSIVNHAEMRGTSVGKRTDIWLNTQPIGLALERIAEIINQGYADKILFIKYENLLNHPQDVMKRVYAYMGLPYYEHDFENIPQITKEDDSVYGIYGDHTIQTKLAKHKHNYNEVLGEQISNFIKERYKWYFDFFEYKD